MIKSCFFHFSFLHRWNSQMQCVPKPVCPSQDRPVRMVVSQWLTFVQDYPWASAWLISPDQARASALQPIDTHRSYPSKSEWKCLSSPLVTNYHSPWVFPMFSQSYLSGDFWLLYSLTSSLERLDKCCPLITWLSGYSKDLPTYGVNHLSISEKNGWSCTNSWKTIKHSEQFSKHKSLFRRFSPRRLLLYRK